MNTQSQNVAALIGRIMLALIFITSGFGKIGGFEGTAGYIASKGLPVASVVAALTILIELGGGLAILFGFLTERAERQRAERQRAAVSQPAIVG